MKDHDHFSAVLFPHTDPSAEGIKKLLSFFDEMILFRPWHMEGSIGAPLEEGLVRVLHPSDRLKPVVGFQRLLSEYKNWMRLHPEKGYASALSALRDQGSRETSTWDIRKSIRSGGEQNSTPESATTQWHLVLHLAREGEERMKEASEALWKLKGRGSPLQGIADDADLESPLGDLPDFECGSEADEESVERVFEAWYGLFREQLPENAMLVTEDSRVMTCLTALWGEYCAREGDPQYGVHFPWPDLSSLSMEELIPEKRKMLEGTGWGELQILFRGIAEDAGGRLQRMMRLSEDLLRMHAHPAGGRILHFQARFFPLCVRSGSGRRKAILSALSGKTLFLLKASHE